MGSREELLRRLPKEGFLKITAEKPAGAAKLAEGERVALIRKGNELFNLKKFDLARKIFLTTGYSDGLIRLGDLYLKQAKPLEAFRMYLQAPDRKKVEALLEKSVAVLRHWLSEDAPPAAASGPGSAKPASAAPKQATPPAGAAPAQAKPVPSAKPTRLPAKPAGK
jgi:hypothetical protein